MSCHGIHLFAKFQNRQRCLHGLGSTAGFGGGQGTRTVLPFARLHKDWARIDKTTKQNKIQPSLYIHMPCAAG